MDEIRLTLASGHVTLIDAEDEERVRQYNWHATPSPGGIRVRRTVSKRAGRSSYQSLHRFILDDPEGIVDHINHDTLDNRRSNLRATDGKGNAQNRQRMKNNTSGYIGVSWEKEKRKWRASICINGRKTLIGKFDDPVQAARAFNEKALEMRGEYAVLNEV